MSEPTPSPVPETNVVNVFGEPVQLIKQNRDYEYCREGCKMVLVDPHAREITCRECGRKLDAFDWAVKMAREESQLYQRIVSLREQVQRETELLTSILEQEKKAKARIRAAKDSLLKQAGI